MSCANKEIALGLYRRVLKLDVATDQFPGFSCGCWILKEACILSWLLMLAFFVLVSMNLDLQYLMCFSVTGMADRQKGG